MGVEMEGYSLSHLLCAVGWPVGFYARLAFRLYA